MSDSNEAVGKEKQILRDARERGGLAVPLAYVKCSGPGWLQGAITLGGGSLGGALYLGVLGGYSMLWVQMVAMIMGVLMLSAITYVTLSTGKRPFQAINEHVNPVLGWGWAMATLMANMVWCLPQFSLGTAAIKQNLFPGFKNGEGDWVIASLSPFASTCVVCGTLLGVAVGVIWLYDKGGNGLRLFELILKCMVGAIMLCFFGVVVKLGMSERGLEWGKIFSGFIPNLNLISAPAATFDAALAATGEHSDYWRELVVSKQRSVMITAAATAVGINMTFLLPYSMLKKGWDKESRGLAIFDLGTGLFIPFILATSCVVIAAGSQFHTIPSPGALDGSNPKMAKEFVSYMKGRLGTEIGKDKLDELVSLSALGTGATANLESDKITDDQKKALESIVGLESSLGQAMDALPEADRNLAAMLVSRDAFQFAASLEKLAGRGFSQYAFGFGVLAMALSTIIILMLISGFTICEIFGLPHSGWPHRIGCLLAGVGVIGPFIWSKAAFYLVVPTSVFGLTLLPIAYLSFFLLINNREVMGDNKLKGFGGFVFNLAMLITLAVTVFCAGWAAWSKGGKTGASIAVGFYLLAIFVHFLRKQNRKSGSGPGNGGGASDGGSGGGGKDSGDTDGGKAKVTPVPVQIASSSVKPAGDSISQRSKKEESGTVMLTRDQFKESGDDVKTVMLQSKDFKKPAGDTASA